MENEKCADDELKNLSPNSKRKILKQRCRDVGNKSSIRRRDMPNINAENCLNDPNEIISKLGGKNIPKGTKKKMKNILKDPSKVSEIINRSGGFDKIREISSDIINKSQELQNLRNQSLNNNNNNDFGDDDDETEIEYSILS
jgi:hypothetical protein